MAQPADASVSGASSGPEAGPGRHPCPHRPGEAGQRRKGGVGRPFLLQDITPAAPSTPQVMRTSTLEAEHQDGRKAEPSILQSIPANSLGTVPNPFRILPAATQLRELTQAGRVQSCIPDYPLLSFSVPGAFLVHSCDLVSWRGLSMRQTFTSGTAPAPGMSSWSGRGRRDSPGGTGGTPLLLRLQFLHLDS